MRLRDGTIAQPRTYRPLGTNAAPGFAGAGLYSGIVTAVHPRDAETNISKTWTEVDVLTLADLIPLRNVVILTPRAGIEDGEDWTPKPCTPRSPYSDVFAMLKANALAGSADELDGDLVVVSFIDGSTPAVIAQMPRRLSVGNPAPYAAGQADGAARTVRHKNTTVRWARDGSVTMTRRATATGPALATVVLGADGTVSVTAPTVNLGAAGLTALTGVVQGQGVDPFTGATYAALGNASSIVRAKK